MAWPAVIPIIAAAVGAAASVKGQSDANSASQANAREQMAFQERMAQKAHRYEVRDLRRAGLNPILSAGGKGAATPSGAMADAKSTTSGAADTLVSGIGKSVDGYLAGKQGENIDSQVKLNSDMQTKAKADAGAALAETELKRADLPGRAERSRFDAEKAKMDREFIGTDRVIDMTGKGVKVIESLATTAKSGAQQSPYGKLLKKVLKRP